MGSELLYRCKEWAIETVGSKWHLVFSNTRGIFHGNLDTDTKYSANRTVQQMALLLGICIEYF